MASLNKSELQRYSRHLLLPEVGIEGQERLKKARILVIGAGGLGSPTILYLAAAGVGTIGIVDFDQVDLSNLQRQIIYTNDDVSSSKVERAAARATSLNPEIQLQRHDVRLSSENALEIFSGYDIIVDGTDNFSTRYLVNDACVFSKKPNVYGAIYRFEGQASVFAHKDGPCYRCLFPDPPPPDAVPNCAEGGVLGVMAGIIGCIQATEALKIILGIGNSLSGKLLIYDSLAMNFDSVAIPKNPNCPICGTNPSIQKLEDITVTCESQQAPTTVSISATELERELKSGHKLLLLDVRTPQEVAISRIADSTHIELAELPNRLSELNSDADIVAYCKSGVRSNKAVQLLLEHGFKKARNLEGGITSWAKEIDPSLNVY
jgi:adenylyltransferase/sulfurtransferase